MQRSIRTKLALAVLVPVAAISVAVVAIDFYTLRAAAYDFTQTRLQERTSLLADRLNETFNAVAQAASQSAAQIARQPDLSDEDLYRLAESSVRSNRLIFGSCIAFDEFAHDPARRLFAPYVCRVERFVPPTAEAGTLRAMDIGRDGYDYLQPDCPWFAPVRDFGRAQWSEPYFDGGAGNEHMVTYAAPFFTRAGRFRGVATTDIRLEDLNALINSIEAPGQEVTISSASGMLIVHPNPQRLFTDSLLSIAKERRRADWIELAGRISAGRSGVERLQGLEDDSRSIVAYAPIPSAGWSLVASVNERQIMAPVFAKLWQSVIVLLTGFLLIGAAVMAATFQIIAPLKRLAGAVRTLSRGDLEAGKVPVTTRDEIGQLGHAFNEMTADLRRHIDALTREVAARQRVEDELEIGRQIQSSLMPARYPEDPRYDAAGLWLPAGPVGGDFFDCFTAPDGSVALLIADVSGKGIPAAIFMARARTVLHETIVAGLGPAQALTVSNRYLVPDNAQSMFVTAVAARYNPETGVFRYASAGHPPPVVICAEGVSIVPTTTVGTLIGAVEGLTFQEHEVRLDVGDTIVLYTDGISEARDPSGALYTPDRFAAFLAAHKFASCRELCEKVLHELDAFQGPKRADDLTLLALRRTR